MQHLNHQYSSWKAFIYHGIILEIHSWQTHVVTIFCLKPKLRLYLARFADGMRDTSGGKPASLDDTMPGWRATEPASSVAVSSSLTRLVFSTLTCVVSHGTIPSLTPLSTVSETNTPVCHSSTSTVSRWLVKCAHRNPRCLTIHRRPGKSSQLTLNE